jgi:hypothetical protein
MFAATIEDGKVIAPSDVCLTPMPGSPPPIVPQNYVNTGCNQLGFPFSTKVMINRAFALTNASQIRPTSGDERGINGGIMSGTFMQAAQFTQGSTKVMIEGKPAVFNNLSTIQNNINAQGSHLKPSQNKVMING